MLGIHRSTVTTSGKAIISVSPRHDGLRWETGTTENTIGKRDRARQLISEPVLFVSTRRSVFVRMQ